MLSLIRGNFYHCIFWKGAGQFVEEREGGEQEKRKTEEANLEVFFWPSENLRSLLWDPSLEEKTREIWQTAETERSGLQLLYKWQKVWIWATEMARWWIGTAETARKGRIQTKPVLQFQGYIPYIYREGMNCPASSPGLHLGLCCSLGCKGRSPMRTVTELCGGAALLAQGRVCVLRLGSGWESGLGVLLLGLLLLLFVAGQAEEEAKDGFQITMSNLCGWWRRMWS